MRFYTKQHPYYCGIDLHAKTMYVCVLDSEGKILVHRNIPSKAYAFLEIIEPYRPDVAVAVECIFTWYWLAEMRATRDLLRRRLHFVRKRGELLAHIENTKSQYNLPDFSARLAYAGNRKGVAEHFPDPCVRRSIEADLELIDHYDDLIGKIEWHVVRAGNRCDQDLLLRLRTIPGIGKILSLTILYEVHDVARFPRVQDFVSYSRLVKCARESAGKRSGTSGRKIGNVHLKWAFSEAAVLFLRNNPKARAYLQRMAHKHGKAKSLSILAHKIGRATYYMMARRQTFDMERFYQGS